VENPYLLHRGGGGGGGGGGGQGARPHALLAHMRRSWWLWSTAAFAVCLIGGLLVFRNSLYDSGAHGLPFLAGARLAPAPGPTLSMQLPPVPRQDTSVPLAVSVHCHDVRHAQLEQCRSVCQGIRSCAVLLAVTGVALALSPVSLHA